jgi:ATP-dependent Clp protease ATP-binding subunit ClpA
MKLRERVRDVKTIKKLLTGAEEEAHRAGDAMPGPEHLLLSAIALDDGSARRAFVRVGADPDELRDAIARQHADALRSVGIAPPDEAAFDDAALDGAPKGVFRSTAPARSAFQAASDTARSGGGGLLGVHVVAAVADLEHGTAARSLAAMGIDRHALAAAARDEASS